MTDTTIIPNLYSIPSIEGIEPASKELATTILSIKTRNNDNLIQNAVIHIPLNDIHLVAEKMAHYQEKEMNEQFFTQNYSDIVYQLAFIRLSNRICDHCGNKDNLQICENCYLTWYCNRACQEAHWNKHKLRCCNKRGPLDEGYQKIIFENI